MLELSSSFTSLSSDITTHEDLNNEVPVSENNSVDKDDSQSQDEQKCQPSNDICDTDTRYTLTLFEEFVLTLVRIRRGYDTNHLSFLFGISQSHVCRIFITWVNFLAKCFEQLIIWPSKQLVKDNLPASFREFPNTRCIIDCSEIYVEKPFRPKAQRTTWSNYKHANTFKLLVGIVPTGTITFISKLYSGSISDQAIVN